MSFGSRRVRAEPEASVFVSPGQGDSGRLSVTQRCDRSSPRGHPRRRQPRSSPPASPARGPRPRPREGEGSPRHKPASGPAQNTPPPKNFFHQPRETCALFARHVLVPSCWPPRVSSASLAFSPGGMRGPGADPRAGQLGGHGGGGEGKGRRGEGGGGSGGGTGQRGP